MKSAGVDIGTNGVQACLYSLETQKQPEFVSSFRRNCPILCPQPLWYEHDLTGLERVLREVLDCLPPDCPVGFTSAMHGLVLVDRNGEALGHAPAWSDCRSAEQASELKARDPVVHFRTGTPVHSMAWPSKLLWFKKHRPEVWENTARLLDLKAYLLERLTGERGVLDISSASGTGLWNQEACCWDEGLCALLEVPSAWLPQVEGPRHKLTLHGRTLVIGAGDGPAGNLGSGAVRQGRIAMFLGASGAVRTFLDTPGSLPASLFRYHLDHHSWVEGGAISNGGSALEWLRSQRKYSAPELFGLIEQSPPGARGIKVYPYFQGERAPFWRSGITSHVEGLEAYHGFSDLVRATLEGVAFCLNRLLDELPPPTEPLRCTGFMFSNIIWCQLLADVTGFPVARGIHSLAPVLGAALFTRPDYLELSAEIEAGGVVAPSPELHARYQDLYPDWAAKEPHRV